ncbi:MAG TPA: hypothetical protein VKB35_14310 [Ktedonobacteraceae bacterium]|nr:hypothetical protein [Ktedonobacteraceae bacterium]
MAIFNQHTQATAPSASFPATGSEVTAQTPKKEPNTLEDAPSAITPETVQDPELRHILAGSNIPFLGFVWDQGQTTHEDQTTDEQPIDGRRFSYRFPIIVQSKTWVKWDDGSTFDAPHKNAKFDAIARRAASSQAGSLMTLGLSLENTTIPEANQYLADAVKPEKQQQYIASLVQTAINTHQKGIVVDYEIITDASRDNFTRYMQLLSEAAAAEHVPVLTTLYHNHGTIRWNFEDLTALSHLAHLRFILMAVDQDSENPNGGPGPNMSFPWLQLLFDDLRDHMRGNEALRKCVLEWPAYAKRWTYDASDQHPRIAKGDDNISMDEVQALRRSVQVIEESTDPEEPWFSYCDAQGILHTVYYVTKTSLFGGKALVHGKEVQVKGVLPRAQEEIRQRLGDPKYLLITAPWAMGYQSAECLRGAYEMSQLKS